MGWLTGNQIAKEVNKQKIKITPFSASQVNPNSYDYRLAKTLRVLRPNSTHNSVYCLDPKKRMKYDELTIPPSGFLMQPDTPYLGHTVEKFGSRYFASLCTGKSSVGRIFLQNHMCAGLIDQGFYGHITLEMTVELPTIVYPNMRIGQMFWFESVGTATLYAGKYQYKNAARPSKIYKDVTK